MSIAEVTTNTHKSILKEIKNNLKKKKEIQKNHRDMDLQQFYLGFHNNLTGSLPTIN